jgi:hypothetical protein
MRIYTVNSRGEIKPEEVSCLISCKVSLLNEMADIFCEQAKINKADLVILSGLHQPVSKFIFFSSERLKSLEEGAISIADKNGASYMYKVYATEIGVEANLCDGNPIYIDTPVSMPINAFLNKYKSIVTSSESDKKNPDFEGYFLEDVEGLTMPRISSAAVKYDAKRYTILSGSEMDGIVNGVEALWRKMGDVDILSNQKFKFLSYAEMFDGVNNLFSFFVDFRDYMFRSDLDYDICNIRYSKNSVISFNYKQQDRDEPLRTANIYLRKGTGNSVIFLLDTNLGIYMNEKDLKKDLLSIETGMRQVFENRTFITEEEVGEIRKCIDTPIIPLINESPKTYTPDRVVVRRNKNNDKGAEK